MIVGIRRRWRSGVYLSTVFWATDPTCHDERMSDDLVSVLWTSSLVEAEIAKGRLEAESIPVELRGEGADAPVPVGSDGGTLRVQSRPGLGTSLLIELPIDHDQPPGPS